MERFVFATHNANKSTEIGKMTAGVIDIVNLDNVGIDEDIPETGTTFEANALQKADYVYQKLGMNCFADDSGLMVEALDNEPGVYSARYAGEPVDMARNIEKLLDNIKDKPNRKAKFVTVIALIHNGERHFFKGVVNGRIIDTPRGSNGFGYDPIFVPDGYDRTFAELSSEEKNKISHRSKAMGLLLDYLLKQ